jgi:hypothetical protein
MGNVFKMIDKWVNVISEIENELNDENSDTS